MPSTTYSDTTGFVIGLFENFTLESQCIYATAAFFVFDSLLTSTREVTLFWNNKCSSATIILLSNQVLVLLSCSLDLILRVNAYTIESCTMLQNAASVIKALHFLPWAGFSFLRAFALSQSWILSIIILVLTLIPFGVNMYGFAISKKALIFPLLGCLSQGMPIELTIRLTFISRLSLIVSDIMLVIITWVKVPRRAILSTVSLSDILWRDGTIYFVLLSILNVLHLTFTALSIFGNGAMSHMTSFTDPLTAVLVSHFLLDLQQANQRSLNLGSDHRLDSSSSKNSGPGTLIFERVIGSLGSIITSQFSDDVNGEEEEIVTL